jgi:hypothetical protein
MNIVTDVEGIIMTRTSDVATTTIRKIEGDIITTRDSDIALLQEVDPTSHPINQDTLATVCKASQLKAANPR